MESCPSLQAEPVAQELLCGSPRLVYMSIRPADT